MNESLPQTIGGKYRVIRELGRGGMGVVYAVEHMRTGEHLALKVLSSPLLAVPELRTRFEREARAPARIRSEHVVWITDADVAPELNGAMFFVMELLEGCSLGQQIREGGPLSPSELLPIVRQLGRALDKAHAQGIVHRDLKPENVFLTRRERGEVFVKLLDFGVSKVLEDTLELSGQQLTQPGAALGTPLFMAPEQVRGAAAAVGPAIDVWAFGMLVYFSLAGTHYFRVNSIAELMYELTNVPIEPPSARWPRLGAAFDRWFLRCCHREVNARFARVGDAVMALEQAFVQDGAIESSVESGSTGSERATMSPGRPDTASIGGARSSVQLEGSTAALSQSGQALRDAASGSRKPGRVISAIAITAMALGAGVAGAAYWRREYRVVTPADSITSAVTPVPKSAEGGVALTTGTASDAGHDVAHVAQQQQPDSSPDAKPPSYDAAPTSPGVIIRNPVIKKKTPVLDDPEL